jgi:hypothetical protein
MRTHSDERVHRCSLVSGQSIARGMLEPRKRSIRILLEILIEMLSNISTYTKGKVALDGMARFCYNAFKLQVYNQGGVST